MKRTLMALIASVGLSTLGGAAVFADEAPGAAKPAETTPAAKPAKTGKKHGGKKATKPAEEKKLGTAVKGSGAGKHRRAKGTPRTPVATPAATTPMPVAK